MFVLKVYYSDYKLNADITRNTYESTDIKYSGLKAIHCTFYKNITQ